MVSTASTLTPPRHSWHPRAFSRDIHTLTNRSRVNLGHYVLWVDRSNRVRIHEMVGDYEVDVISTYPTQRCEICAKKGPAVADETPKPEAADEKQVRSDEPKRERCEHLSGGGTRSTVRTKGLR